MTFRSVLTAIATILVALFAVPLSAATAEAPSPDRASPYVYDSDAHVTVSTYTTAQRAPPAAHNQGSIYHALGHRSRGPSARSDADGAGPTTTYTTRETLAHGAPATTTTGRQAEVAEGELGALRGASVAANSADDVAQVTKNQIAGNKFRDSVAARLEAEEGFTILDKEFGVKTRLGWRYIDILAERNGSIVAFETKLGGSRYLPSQRAKDWWMSKIGVDVGDGSLTQIPTVLIRGPLN